MKRATVLEQVADERWLRALEAAEACIKLLKERFGARRMILFGSLVGQGPWHAASDIDLAVEGLPAEDFFQAYSACRDLVLPHGLDLDLVPLCELHGLAAYLHQFYTGVESIFQRIAVSLGEGLPRGAYWHMDLLNQMADAQEGVRPAVINEPLRARLKDYLDFRHFFRHAYGHTLKWHKMRWKAENMAETLEMLRRQLMDFFGELTGKDDAP